MFDKMKDMYQFQRQARQIRKELKAMSFSAATSNGRVTVTCNGEMKVIDVALRIEPSDCENPGRLNREIADTVNKAVEKAQKASAEKMKGIMGYSGMPGT